jgi:2-aminoethylphosphonate-pyruvate transaminase
LTASKLELAVVLAAGQGIRLGELGEEIPKGMIRLGEQPILEESIGRLRRAGIRRVVVVTGHLAGQLAPLAQRAAGMVELVRNERYARGGSLSSLLCALNVVQEDFLLLESDLVYEQRAVDTLVAREPGSVVLVSGQTHAGDEVWVETTGATGGHGLVAMSKDRGSLGPHVLGELTGITRISATAIPALRACAQALAAPGAPADYEDALVALARVARVQVSRIDDLLWAEIDPPAMLERVRRMVYPEIARADANELVRAAAAPALR